MNKRLAEISHRRRLLTERIQEQRREVSAIFQQWHRPLAVIDAGLKYSRFLYQHPAWVAGGVAGIVAMRGKGIVGLAKKSMRLLWLYPSALVFGFKFLSLATRSPDKKQVTDVDH